MNRLHDEGCEADFSLEGQQESPCRCAQRREEREDEPEVDLSVEEFIDGIAPDAMPVEALQITWKTLVTYRDIALEQAPPDFERVVIYSNVIEDIATMIQAMGAELPKTSGAVADGE